MFQRFPSQTVAQHLDGRGHFKTIYNRNISIIQNVEAIWNISVCERLFMAKRITS